MKIWGQRIPGSWYSSYEAMSQGQTWSLEHSRNS